MVILAFFLVLSLGFEYLIDAAEYWLKVKGRVGLARALQKVVNEITLLGFVSLVLMLFQQYVPDICVPYSDSAVTWTMLDNLNACPCCLSQTSGITTCAQIDHGCAFNLTTKAPYCGCHSTKDYSFADDADCAIYTDNEDVFVLTTLVEGVSYVAEGANLTYSQTCQALEAIWNASDANYTATSNKRRLQSLQNTAEHLDIPAVVHIGRQLKQLASLSMLSPTFNDYAAGPSSSGGAKARSPPLSPPPNGAPTPEDNLMNLLTNDTSSNGTIVVATRGQEDHIIPQILEFSCQGPFYSAKCSPGYFVAISNQALNQMHVLIFLVAAFHVVAAVVVVLVASVRIQQWKRWQIQSMDSEPADFPIRSSVMLDEESNTYASKGPAPQMETTNTSIVPVDSEPLGRIDTTDSSTTSRGVDFKALAESIKRHWAHRELVLDHPRLFWGEALTCLVKAFWPNVVSRTDFLIIRKAWLEKYDLSNDYDFVGECVQHLDFDLARIVGASLIMWFVLILLFLFSGLASWTICLFLLVGAVLLFAIDVGLVAAVRYSCRGGVPHEVTPAKRWWHNARWLSVPIGGLIFLCSLIYSTAVFFAWQFGPNSCVFVQDATFWSFVPTSLPWWLALIVAGVLLLFLASVTIPAWVIVSHMRPLSDRHHKEETTGIQEKETTGPRTRAWKSQKELISEINRLQEELHKWQM